jgi:hypothetical protein
MGADGNEILLMQEPYSIEGKVPGLGTGTAVACRGSKQDTPMAGVGIRSRHMTAIEIAGLCTTHSVSVQISDGAMERRSDGDLIRSVSMQMQNLHYGIVGAPTTEEKPWRPSSHNTNS